MRREILVKPAHRCWLNCFIIKFQDINYLNCGKNHRKSSYYLQWFISKGDCKVEAHWAIQKIPRHVFLMPWKIVLNFKNRKHFEDSNTIIKQGLIIQFNVNLLINKSKLCGSCTTSHAWSFSWRVEQKRITK